MNADCFPRLVIGTLIIVGIWNAFNPGMIFGGLRRWIIFALPIWITKPLFDCPPCMASTWGTLVWFLTGGDVSWQWSLYVVALSGLCKLVVIQFLK